MTRKPRIPSYRLHKASGQAVVVLRGTSVYLGKWNTPESRIEYQRVIAEWLANGKRLSQPDASPAGTAGVASAPNLTVSEQILAFWDHARKHYRHADGRPTREQDNLRDALRPLRRLYGHTRAVD